MTEKTFKTRYTLHKSSLKHIKHRKQTELSNLIGSHSCHINPASNNLGKVSKRILDDVNSKCRAASGVNKRSGEAHKTCSNGSHVPIQRTSLRKKLSSSNLAFASSTHPSQKSYYGKYLIKD